MSNSRNARRWTQSTLIRAAALLLILAGWSWAGVVVPVTVPSPVIGIGSSTDVSIGISGLNPPSLGAFDLVLAFDPSILTYQTTIFGDPILGDLLNPSNTAFTGSIPGPGNVEVFELSFEDLNYLSNLPASSFTLARIRFLASGPGTTQLGVTINALGDSLGNPIVATASPASLTAVPEPGALTLVAAGMSAVLLFRRKFSRG